MARFRLRPDGAIQLSENDVEKACIQLLQYKHYYPIRLQSGLFPNPDKLCEACRSSAPRIRVGEPGIPDYVIPAFFLEVKAPGKKASDVQQEKIRSLKHYWSLETALVDRVEALLEWLRDYEEP